MVESFVHYYVSCMADEALKARCVNPLESTAASVRWLQFTGVQALPGLPVIVALIRWDSAITIQVHK